MAGLTLEKIDVVNVGERADVLEKVVRQLRAGAMPPQGRPRPDQTTAGAFVVWLEAALDRAATNKPKPGRPRIHRSNPAECANSIRDALSLKIAGRALLPPADADHPVS